MGLGGVKFLLRMDRVDRYVNHSDRLCKSLLIYDRKFSGEMDLSELEAGKEPIYIDCHVVLLDFFLFRLRLPPLGIVASAAR